MTRIDGQLYHLHTSNLFAKVGNFFNGNFVDHKSYDHAEESMNAEIEGMGYGLVGGAVLGKLGSWAGKALSKVGNSVWKLNSLQRGVIIEEMMGHNLPKNFPVLDKFVKGVATSIKSIDLSLKSYNTKNGLYNTVKGYVDKLANFEKGKLQNTVIDASKDIKERILDLAIPPNATSAQVEALQKVTEYGTSVGVKVNITVFR